MDQPSVVNDHREQPPARDRRWISALDVYIWSVVALATVLLAVVAASERSIFLSEHTLVFVVFAGLLIAGELSPIKWLRLDDGGEVTMSWAFAIALLFVGSITASVIAFAAASAISDLTHRKPLKRLAFNSAQLMIALIVAGSMMEFWGYRDTLASGDRLGLWWLAAIAVASVSAFLVNGALICVALAMHEGTSVPQMLRKGVLPNLSTDGALLALAPCFVAIADRSLLLLPLVLITAAFVHRSSRAALEGEHAANHDSLTELLNRRAFDEVVKSCLSESGERGCVLALIDLNGFKAINDRLGHHVGDHVLQEVGRRLVAARRPGVIAARLGGDEFAVLFTQISTAEQALTQGWEIHQLISQTSSINGYPIEVGGSVGLALAPVHGEDAETLMRNADMAMYRAKRARTGVALYTPEPEARDVGRIRLLEQLEAGIRRDELLLHFQPQLDLATGELVAIEALVRWQHPQLGLVSPGEFMPLAEQTPLMDAITETVLRQALATCSRLRDAGHDLRVAVNASAHNVANLRFPKVVERLLHEAGLPASVLELELTENSVMSDPARVKAVLEQLSEAGIRLALDDFGTGYSSLTNLRQLPIDVIKIDRSFVRDLAIDADDREIVRSMIELAHGLRLEVASEGVEDQQALDLLAQYGSDSAQGYLLGRPMTEAALFEFIRERSEIVELKEAS